MRITVVGLGYVGLVTAVGFALRGHDVRCVEKQRKQLETIKGGQSPFFEPGLEPLLAKALESEALSFFDNLAEAIQASQVTVIAVGTPSTENGIDLSAIENAARQVAQNLSSAADFHTVAIKSTVVPGTTDGAVKAIMEKETGLKAGVDFGLGMVPEFLAEGSAVKDMLNPDRVVIGADDARSHERLEQLFYEPDCPILNVSTRSAEMIKYASNSLLATLISFSNEIATICEAVPGLSEEQVMQGVHLDRRFSLGSESLLERKKPGILQFIRGGIGFGGSCFPKDVKALRTWSEDRNISVPLLQAVLDINQTRPERIVELLKRTTGPLRDKTVAVLGLAFKGDTSDVRESPSLRIIRNLAMEGAKVKVHDPKARLTHCEEEALAHQHGNIESVLKDAHVAIIATRWEVYGQIDWPALLPLMAEPVVFDGRQMIAPEQRKPPMIYRTIGMA